MSKQKTNPNKITCTLADIKRYQKQVDEEWAKKEKDLYLDSARWASIFHQSITFLALVERFKFSVDDLQALQEYIDTITAKILDLNNDYTLESVQADLLKYDVELDTEELRSLKGWND